MTEMVTVVLEAGEHDDDNAALFPNHLPEVGHGLVQRPLAHDVRRIPWVVVRLIGIRETVYSRILILLLLTNSLAYCKDYAEAFCRFSLRSLVLRRMCEIGDSKSHM